MTISRDLMMSILSMDAYHRGYNAGMANLDIDTGTQIGNATFLTESNVLLGSPEVAASFYARAYTIGSGVTGVAPGTTVIAYRGTDAFAYELPFVDFPISYAADSDQKQIAMAAQFFRAVDAQSGGAPITPQSP
jgi:hypothetical protein